MSRISVTEMAVWQECQLRWWYKYKMDAPRKAAMGGARSSGSAIHAGIEMGIISEGSKESKVERACEAADLYLAEELNEKQAARFTAGAHRAIGAVPAWCWEVELPQVELKMEIEISPGLIIVGKPDLWYIDGLGMHIVDFKSTSKDFEERLAQYEQWNPQLRRYAVLLRQHLNLDIPIYTRHIVIGTTGKSAVGEEYLENDTLLEVAKSEMIHIGRTMGESNNPIAHWDAFQCNGCDYQDIDIVRRSGGDWRGLVGPELPKPSDGPPLTSV